jgi:hypothetical protein
VWLRQLRRGTRLANVDSLEVSENSETLDERKGSQIVCDWRRGVKREQNVRLDPGSKKPGDNR